MDCQISSFESDRKICKKGLALRGSIKDLVYPLSGQSFLLIPPANTRRPKLFLCCQWVKNGNIGQKYVNSFCANVPDHFQALQYSLQNLLLRNKQILKQIKTSQKQTPKVFQKQVFLTVLQNSQRSICVGVPF